MLKKFAVIALALLFVGVASLAWVIGEKRKEQQQNARYKLKYASETQEYLKQYNKWLQLPPEERGLLPWGLDEDGKAKSEAQLLQGQQERLNADLDKLAAGETQIYPFTDILYGPDWQETLSKYKSQKEFREFVLTSSILCLAAGGIIFSWCFLLSTARFLIKYLSAFRAFLSGFISRRRKTGTPQPIRPAAKQVRDGSDRQQGSNKRQKQVAGGASLGSAPASHSKVLINSGWHSPAETQTANPPERYRSSWLQRALGVTAGPGDTAEKVKISNDDGKTAVLLSDDEAPEFEKPLKVTPATLKLNAGRLSSQPQNICSAALMVPQEGSVNLDDLLKAQTRHLEKQVTEFRQMAQTVQQTALEHSKPLENGLKELTEQISAIRGYAAQQQNRMEKLQDGYDWNIIRTFCLRVIRCIDNLENRIAQLPQRDVETTQLEEVKDELVFALESSGIEQFEPQLYSEYCGQEKKAEAVKDKFDCDDPNMSGKIAEVVRPGYQYVIDDQNVKVVRMAQVKLFE